MTSWWSATRDIRTRWRSASTSWTTAFRRGARRSDQRRGRAPAQRPRARSRQPCRPVARWCSRRGGRPGRDQVVVAQVPDPGPLAVGRFRPGDPVARAGGGDGANHARVDHVVAAVDRQLRALAKAEHVVAAVDDGGPAPAVVRALVVAAVDHQGVAAFAGRGPARGGETDGRQDGQPLRGSCLRVHHLGCRSPATNVPPTEGVNQRCSARGGGDVTGEPSRPW
jgi:hypothetical protein